MQRIYFDNAATTQLDPAVAEAMISAMGSVYGNPSSTHDFGRRAKAEVEKSRRTVSSLLHTSPAQIIFTSGGTEADNMAIRCSIRDLGVTHVISSRIEHPAVLHTIEAEMQAGRTTADFVRLRPDGHVDFTHLEELLKEHPRSLVSLMHANNEIGDLLGLKRVAALCRKYDSLFHSDTVQTMAHYRFDLSSLGVDFVTASAHKFHGPKGVGFLYCNADLDIKKMIHGGSQERDMRGGTENLYSIIGLAKAFEVAHARMDEHHLHIQGLKTYMIDRLRSTIPDIAFNGDAEGSSHYTVLNASFPETPISEMLLFNLDIMGIAVSGGSACASGTNIGSHVLEQIAPGSSRPAVRFSFGKFNTREEVDVVIGRLGELFA